MAENQIQELLATARPRVGKGAARATRREGNVPAVIYGDKKAPESIALNHNELVRLIRRGHFMASVFDIKVDGRSVRALPRDIQFDPVKDQPVHVDFQRIAADGRIRLAVPVELINEDKSPGMRRGGVLNIVRHEIEIFCPAASIPSGIEVDLTGADIGSSIHISAVKLPEGVEPTITDRDFTIVTIAGSAAAKSDADEDEGAGEEAAGGQAAAGDERADDEDED
jgi:large subunit ribosomal protein L25